MHIGMERTVLFALNVLMTREDLLELILHFQVMILLLVLSVKINLI